MEVLNEIVHNPLVHGALTGLVSAATVDFAAFRSWKSFDEAHAYNWPTAYWRWFQGTLTGLVVAAGIGVAL